MLLFSASCERNARCSAITAEQAAGAHQADLATQGRYGVDYKQYWVDEEHGRIFCLVDARDADAAISVHVKRTVSSPTRSFRSPKAAEPAACRPDKNRLCPATHRGRAQPR